MSLFGKTCQPRIKLYQSRMSKANKFPPSASIELKADPSTAVCVLKEGRTVLKVRSHTVRYNSMTCYDKLLFNTQQVHCHFNVHDLYISDNKNLTQNDYRCKDATKIIKKGVLKH